MSKKPTIAESNLIIGDRINFPFIIGTAILEYIKNRNRPELEFSPKQIKESAITISKLIPLKWQDEQYKKEREKCFFNHYYDNRKLWCGVRAGKLTMENVGVFKDVHPDNLVQVVMGLLHRRKMLAKSIPQELMSKFED